ncbi:hypothetical protein BT63DRAFT_410771 [Microthyrium microscopicum]|uniref:Uncharacterized protein n=1 Tax=Microthyrium microscopicum TaxID=703497 RepID=A0A6A6USB0_9PEZI|nr:hypothetical protein BT63DRAFT_410771 [Microthyrium microscopicum]
MSSRSFDYDEWVQGHERTTNTHDDTPKPSSNGLRSMFPIEVWLMIISYMDKETAANFAMTASFPMEMIGFDAIRHILNPATTQCNTLQQLRLLEGIRRMFPKSFLCDHGNCIRYHAALPALDEDTCFLKETIKWETHACTGDRDSVRMPDGAWTTEFPQAVMLHHEFGKGFGMPLETLDFDSSLYFDLVGEYFITSKQLRKCTNRIPSSWLGISNGPVLGSSCQWDSVTPPEILASSTYQCSHMHCTTQEEMEGPTDNSRKPYLAKDWVVAKSCRICPSESRCSVVHVNYMENIASFSRSFEDEVISVGSHVLHFDRYVDFGSGLPSSKQWLALTKSSIYSSYFTGERDMKRRFYGSQQRNW